jgi:hypothetical protein
MERGDSEHNQPHQQAPRLAERLLEWCLPTQDQGPVLGDLAEEFHQRGANVRAAGLWYWWQVLRSFPTLLLFAGKKVTRSLGMEKLLHLSQPNVRLAGVGLVLIVPALILCAAGVTQVLLGMNSFSSAINFDLLIFNPVVLLGGLSLALALNLLPVMGVKFQDGSLIGEIKIRNNVLNLALLTFGGTLLGVIFLYLLAENFYIFAQ